MCCVCETADSFQMDGQTSALRAYERNAAMADALTDAVAAQDTKEQLVALKAMVMELRPDDGRGDLCLEVKRLQKRVSEGGCDGRDEDARGPVPHDHAGDQGLRQGDRVLPGLRQGSQGQRDPGGRVLPAPRVQGRGGGRRCEMRRGDWVVY